jgi:hypothetical protein
MEPWLVGGVLGGTAVLLLGLLLPGKKCPDCSQPLPRFRKPANISQALWGGWVCSRCGCKVDRRGRKVVP